MLVLVGTLKLKAQGKGLFILAYFVYSMKFVGNLAKEPFEIELGLCHLCFVLVIMVSKEVISLFCQFNHFG